MIESCDTGYALAAQEISDNKRDENPGPATKEEREAHFYARHSAKERGEQMKPNDERLHRWPKKDRINWIAGRLLELDKEISECPNASERKSLEQAREDCLTWMRRERDDLSWSKIAQNRAERLKVPKEQSYAVIEAFEMQARRACERVERHHPGSKSYKPEPLQIDAFCPNCGYELR
jgi:hypothetical protein